MRTVLTRASILIFATAGLLVAACGGDDVTATAPDSGTDGPSRPDGGVDAAHPVDAAQPVDSGMDAARPTDAGVDAPPPVDAGVDAAPQDSGADVGVDAGCITLTVKDAPTSTPWCKISINSAAASTAGVQTVCVPSGTTVSLVATPQPGFTIGPDTWHDTAGDVDGGGDNGTGDGGTSGSSATTVVVTATKTCVWACCPGAGGVPACPTTDQCP